MSTAADYTFKTTVTVDEALMHSALENSTKAAKAGLEEPEGKTDQQAIDWWKNTTRRIVIDNGGLFLTCTYKNNQKVSFAFCDTFDGVFHVIGGFWDNINGSSKYCLTGAWWTALADFCKAEGYDELRVDIKRNHSLEQCCNIIADKIDYECEWDDDIMGTDNIIRTFRIYL